MMLFMFMMVMQEWKGVAVLDEKSKAVNVMNQDEDAQNFVNVIQIRVVRSNELGHANEFRSCSCCFRQKQRGVIMMDD